MKGDVIRDVRIGVECAICMDESNVDPATVEELCEVHLMTLGRAMESRGAVIRPDRRPA